MHDPAKSLHPDILSDGLAERRLVDAHLGRRYQVVRELGRGGMGVVFLARDVALHRTVALKVLRHELAGDEEGRIRFWREARLTARLAHPAIVPVHTAGEEGPLVYIVMEHVHGESLAQRLAREGRLDAGEARRIVAELADALAHAHAAGIVHRDLKPENVLLEGTAGRVRLTDFGVALYRAADHAPDDASRAFGSPHWMSPEQALGELDLDGRSDLYSLGALGWAMLAGRPPFEGASFASLTAHHVATPLPPLHRLAPEAPRPLVAAIERCLEKERERRWRSAAELREALDTGTLTTRLVLASPGLRAAATAAAMAASVLRAGLARWLTV